MNGVLKREGSLFSVSNPFWRSCVMLMLVIHFIRIIIGLTRSRAQSRLRVRIRSCGISERSDIFYGSESVIILLNAFGEA